MISPYPKIFALGTSYIKDIFNQPVEITEKIDGSQFVFGKVNGTLCMRSKGAMLYSGSADGMFKEGIEYVKSIESRLPNNVVFYAEYLRKPKHNAIAYNRIPKNHLALYGIHYLEDDEWLRPERTGYDELLEVDNAPTLLESRIKSVDEIKSMLDQESYLGKEKIEGVVVKNYHRKWIIGDHPMPLMAGKLVSEKFKEVNRHEWKAKSNSLDDFYKSFKTEARWEKAVQRARESGELKCEPQDIGKLIRSLHEDIAAEEENNIKDFLWCEFSGNIMRSSTAGFAEWYKEKLMEGCFE